MEIKTDFSKLWKQVDRIIENRLPSENEMKINASYENVRLLSENMMNAKINIQQYTTIEDKKKLTTLVDHSSQLLSQLEKPTLSHELVSSSNHEMEL